MDAHAATKTYYCKAPGCENEARSPVGQYAYCDEHRGKGITTARASRNGAASAATGTEKALRDLLALAKGVDKAKARADTLRRKANDADRQADELEAEYRDALASAARGDV